MRIVLGFIAMAAVLFVGVCLAEEEQTEGEKHFDLWKSEFLGGVWEAKDKDGGVISAEFRLLKEGEGSPTGGEVAFADYFQDSKELNTAANLWTIDSNSGKFSGLFFLRDKSVIRETMTPIEDGWQLDGVLLGSEEEQDKIRCTIKIVDEDTQIWRGFDFLISNEEQNDSESVLKWTRVEGKTSLFGPGLGIDPFEGPKPIAVLIQTNPWLMVMGSDTPMVAIYENGLVVYEKRKKKKPPVLLAKRLSPSELAAIRKKLTSFGDYSELKRYYDLAPQVTDLPETKIYLAPDDGDLVTSVYGLMVSDTQLPAYTSFGTDQKPDELPSAIEDLHRYLTTLEFAGAKPWEPRYVEVMVWGYDYAPDESIHWPKEWPDLDSPSSMKRGDAYSIFLPGKELPKLREFLKTRKEKGAVEIGGKKWAVAYRYSFPNEPIWFQAFRSEPEEEAEEPEESIDKAAQPSSDSEQDRPVDKQLQKERRRARKLYTKLPGYDEFKKEFTIDDAMLGDVNMMPESLFVELQAKGQNVIDSVWWWNPLTKSGEATKNWTEFLKAYHEAEEFVSTLQWLKDLKTLSDDRSVELHMLGTGFGEADFDLETFILPVWKHEGFAGKPSYSLLARRGEHSWVQLVFGSKDRRCLVLSTTGMLLSSPLSPQCELDRLELSWHPKGKPDDEYSRYAIVDEDGTIHVKSYVLDQE